MDEPQPDYVISKVDLSKSALGLRTSMLGFVGRLKEIVESSYLKKDRVKVNPIIPKHRKPSSSD